MTVLQIAEAPPEPQALPFGAALPPFEDLLGTDGLRYGLASFAARDLLVLIFSSNRCPTAKAYGPRMNEVQRDYADRGLQLVAINSNDPHLYPDESYARTIERAGADGYEFPYLMDEGQRLAKACGASCTFHVFLFDRERRLRYTGRFDDSRLPERVTSHDLRDAVDDVLAGRPVRTPETRPFGCSLDILP